MSFEEFIDEHEEDIRKLRKKQSILHQKEVDKLIVNYKAISGITVDDLELTLVKRLLDNLCPRLFMDDSIINNQLVNFLLMKDTLFFPKFSYVFLMLINKLLEGHVLLICT
jgi:hypothetical protein